MQSKLLHSTGFPIVGDMPPPPHPSFFFEPLPLIKTDAPHGAHPPLKNEAPPLKPEAPFHEMIPRKSTINKNLKSD